ncbi:MAG: ribulose-phosphate 3-epimerase [Alphaproteobacteria bacterium]|nr:ribulose-phosphate 3-epimerase [Alphaproteobacteria bacterium]
MAQNIKISPSILSADFSTLGDEIKSLEKAGADLIHVDVMDGHFVPNITMGPPIIKMVRKCTKLPFDVHLMISPVEKYIKAFADAGSDIITIHPEATDNLKRAVGTIKSLGKKAGVSLNPKTPISALINVINDIDLILIMSVNPGFAGQSFMSEVLPKVTELRKMINEKKLKIDIEIDGGINFETAPLAVKAGANILVSGTTIFSGSLKDNIQKLRNCA